MYRVLIVLQNRGFRSRLASTIHVSKCYKGTGKGGIGGSCTNNFFLSGINSSPVTHAMNAIYNRNKLSNVGQNLQETMSGECE